MLPEKDQEGLVESHMAIWLSHQALYVLKSKKEERERKINQKYLITGLQKFNLTIKLTKEPEKNLPR